MDFELKEYQERALNTVAEFFGAAHETGAAAAYMKIAHRKDAKDKPLNPYAAPAYQTFAEGLEDRPHVCVRVPTAGGKTYMAARALPLLQNFREEQWAKAGGTEMKAPLILWLVPKSIIRNQTAKVLSDNSHPCGAAIRNAFGYGMRILDINDFDILMPQDFSDNGAVIISTVQMFAVRETTKENDDGMTKDARRIYAGKEDFEPHFSRFLPNPPPAGLQFGADGKPKHSFANLLHLTRPIVVCDEAHGFTTNLSREVLRRINPACVLEWTATPRREKQKQTSAENIKHNVLCSVSAAELEKAEMIKMPVRVGEHPDWESAVQAAVAERARLEKTAAETGEPVRPVALYKAESIAGDITAQKLKEHLISKRGIAAEEIAIETGETKELTNVNLLDANCKIRHIITVEALREGWDCSFAYVFCSIANVQSETAAEQFLGRIMRMPFAERRAHSALNCAYAHMPADYSTAAVEVLRANLALHMGYEESESHWIIQPNLGMDEEDLWAKGGDLPAEIKIATAPDFDSLEAEERAWVKESVEIKPAEDGGCVAIIRRPVSLNAQNKIIATAPKEKREELRRELQTENMRRKIALSPAKRGKKFAPLPEFLFFSPEADGEVKADNDSLYEIAEWNNIGGGCLLENFSYEERGEIYEISLRGGKVPYEKIGKYQSGLYGGGSPETVRADLAAWLEYEIRNPHGRYYPETLKKLINANLDDLAAKEISVEILTRAKHQLARALKIWLKEHEEKIDRETAENFLFGNKQLKCAPSFQFPPQYSPGETKYAGAYMFQKHYFPEIGAFDSGEEYECAKALDMEDEVKYWIRNISGREEESYKLPLGANRNFYPDFIAELNNGKIIVVEYKGERGQSDEKEVLKRRIGEKMETLSGGGAFFSWITAKGTKPAEKFASIRRQLKDKITAINAAIKNGEK